MINCIKIADRYSKPDVEELNVYSCLNVPPPLYRRGGREVR